MLIENIKIANIREPNAPEIVFFGLIFDNFGPLNVFPTIKPPISEAIQANKIENRKIFNCKLIEK